MFVPLSSTSRGMTTLEKSNLLTTLQSDILRLQGFKPAANTITDAGLGSIIDAFPNRSFPIGHIHEFLSSSTEDVATSSGFIAGLFSTLLKQNGVILWISTARKVFPPALKNFGVQPDRFIFIDLKKEKDVLWAMDEALKCAALTAVVGELKEITFTESQRLQLAVEQSQVTGFVLRHCTKKIGTTACVSRWRITSIPSEIPDELPGLGFPTWRVELLRIRNGKAGVWNLQWKDGRLVPLHHSQEFFKEQKKVG